MPLHGFRQSDAKARAQITHPPFPICDHTHNGRGLAPRSFSSCFEMAEETAISRLYGGNHYRAPIERGLEQGRAIGKQVSALRFGPG
jgi:hypothetical protein